VYELCTQLRLTTVSKEDKMMMTRWDGIKDVQTHTGVIPLTKENSEDRQRAGVRWSVKA